MEKTDRLAVLIDADNAQPAEPLTCDGDNKAIFVRDKRSK